MQNAGSAQPKRALLSNAFFRLLPFAFCLLVALALRLLVWRWRYYYGPGGDEREYLQQALTLLQQHRYVELKLMRPPLYGVFLAGGIVLVDSLVQNLRLLQAFVSAATVAPVWLLTRELFPPSASYRRGVPLVAALLCALSYTLAANAAELLSETLFLFGLTTTLWLLVGAGRRRSWRWGLLAGLGLGLLCLTRSVALPLLPLGAIYLYFKSKGKRQKAKAEEQKAKGEGRTAAPLRLEVVQPFFLFTFAFCLVVLPWTARNYATYGGLILIDTTGAENLWLDNNPAAATLADPLGREAAKRALYALGDDRLARQRLGSQQGITAIAANPDWFARKAGGELLKFFALEYADDMRARPEIWVPPADIAARLVLGDGLWLLILLAGASGLVIARGTERWLLIAWALYVLLTALIFHVELRYRLPLFPVLLPYAALALARSREGKRQKAKAPVAQGKRQKAEGRRQVGHIEVEGKRQRAKGKRQVGQLALAALLPFTFLLLTFTHSPYPALAWQLAIKHIRLASAERALAANDAATATTQAQAALVLDDRSALARVALARVAIERGDTAGAQAILRAAIGAMPDHPQPHLLLGDLLRAGGDGEGARAQFAFEGRSLQDLQAWSWEVFTTPAPTQLDVGGGLDLGFVHGMEAAEKDGWRWTKADAALRLAAPSNTLRLRLASGRPSGAPPPTLVVRLGGATIATLRLTPEWQTYDVPLPPGHAPKLTIGLHTDTFRPRDYDRTSGDDRTLGAMLDSAAITDKP